MKEITQTFARQPFAFTITLTHSSYCSKQNSHMSVSKGEIKLNKQTLSTHFRYKQVFLGNGVAVFTFAIDPDKANRVQRGGCCLFCER